MMPRRCGRWKQSFGIKLGQYTHVTRLWVTIWAFVLRLGVFEALFSTFIIRELTQRRRQRQRKRHKFAYLTMKNNSFARFACAFFIFWRFADVLVLSMTWNDLFCSCVDDVTIWWQIFNFVFLSLKRWFQFNSRIVRTDFASIKTWNNWEMITKTRSNIFRWRSCSRRRRLCVSSLMFCSESSFPLSYSFAWFCLFERPSVKGILAP